MEPVWVDRALASSVQNFIHHRHIEFGLTEYMPYHDLDLLVAQFGFDNSALTDHLPSSLNRHHDRLP